MDNREHRHLSYYVGAMIATGMALLTCGKMEGACCLIGSTLIVLFHEFGHIATARLMGEKVTEFQVRPWGGYCNFAPYEGKYELPKFLVVCVMGPLIGWLVALTIYVGIPKTILAPELIEVLNLWFMAITLDTLVNLLPVWRFDGKHALNTAKEILKNYRNTRLEYKRKSHRPQPEHISTIVREAEAPLADLKYNAKWPGRLLIKDNIKELYAGCGDTA